VTSVAEAARTVSGHAGGSLTAAQDLARLGAELKDLVGQFQV
jgi:methyl-accepting chemotaxis protein